MFVGPCRDKGTQNGILRLCKVPSFLDFPGGSEGKVSAYRAGNLGSIPESGKSPVEGNGNPLQQSCLENPMDGGAWQATVHELGMTEHLHFTSLLFVHIQFILQLSMVMATFYPLPLEQVFNLHSFQAGRRKVRDSF